MALSIEGHAVACPFSALRQMPVVNHRIAAKDIVMFYSGGTRSAFEGALGAARRWRKARQSFWFAWAAVHPETEVRDTGEGP